MRWGPLPSSSPSAPCFTAGSATASCLLGCRLLITMANKCTKYGNARSSGRLDKGEGMDIRTAPPIGRMLPFLHGAQRTLLLIFALSRCCRRRCRTRPTRPCRMPAGRTCRSPTAAPASATPTECSLHPPHSGTSCRQCCSLPGGLVEHVTHMDVTSTAAGGSVRWRCWGS